MNCFRLIQGVAAGCLLMGVQAGTAYARIGLPIPINQSSLAEGSRIESTLHSKIEKDLADHFEEKIHEIAATAEQLQNPPLSPATRELLLKTAYESLALSSPFPLSEKYFDKSVGKALDWLNAHNLTPSSINVGALGHIIVGEAAEGGIALGAEANLYLQDGKVMMTNYSLLGAEAAVGTSDASVEFYVSFCFGSCTGGPRNGWIIGVDGSIADGLGVGLFAEFELDINSLAESAFDEHHMNISDVYQASSFKIGFGFELGEGADTSLGLLHYSQNGKDLVLANAGEDVDSSKLVSELSHVRSKLW